MSSRKPHHADVLGLSKIIFQTFRIRHRPGDHVELRVGVHTGDDRGDHHGDDHDDDHGNGDIDDDHYDHDEIGRAMLCGVVGVKIIRYCLFIALFS